MSNPFHHSRIQLVYHLLIGLLCFITCSIQAQNVGIGTTNPTYPLTLGGTGVVLGVENSSLFMARNSDGVYEPFIYPRWSDNRTILNYGTGGFQIRDMNYTTRFQITDSGHVGINIDTPSTSLHVLGQVRIQDGTQADGKVLTSDDNGVASWQIPITSPEVDPKVGDLAVNKIPKWNGTMLVDGLITDNGTNVGIGTSNPTYPLTLGGIDVVLGVDNGNLFMARNSDGVYEPFIYPRWYDNRTMMNYGTGGFQIRDMTFTTRFQITNSGNVGINTIAPTTSLHVVGQVRIQDGSQSSGKVLTSDDFGTASWQTPSLTETDPQVASTISNRIPKWNGTALTDGLIFDNGTNVGIGTTNPSTKLHVAGQVRIEDGLQAAGKVLTCDNLGVASWQTLPTETDPQVSSNTNNKVPKWNGTALVDGIISDNGTNVGIGTLNPSTKLHIVGQVKIVDGTQGAGKVLMSDTAGVCNWQTLPAVETDPQVASSVSNCVPKWNGTALADGLIYDNGTNVGIGTSNPGTKLHVVGQVKIVDGTQGAGKVLTSDIDGVAGWQTLAVLETDPQVTSTTTNKIPKWNGSTLVDGTITDNGTNVGIGASNPSHQLTLGGTDVVFGIENASVFVAKNSSGVEEPYFYPRWSDNRMLMNYGSGGFQMRDNAYNVRFQITNTGNVGIGTGAPGGLFELTLDQGRKPSTSTWTITSDARVKNIEGQYTKGLDEILQLNPILYHYKNTSNKTFSPEVLAAENVGLTAQEVQQVFPEAVGEDEDGTLNLNMHSILIAQINAIKELNAMIVSQQQQIDELTAKLEEK